MCEVYIQTEKKETSKTRPAGRGNQPQGSWEQIKLPVNELSTCNEHNLQIKTYWFSSMLINLLQLKFNINKEVQKSKL